MVIWKPPLADGLGWAVGMEWPEGNEDLMWDLADDWRAAASALAGIDHDIDDAIAAIRAAYPEGAGGEQMIRQLRAMRSGEGSVEELVKWFHGVAETAEATGNEFEYTKLMFHATLVLLAAEIALVWLFPPTAPAEEAVLIAGTRVGVRMLIRRLLTRLSEQSLKHALMAALKSPFGKRLLIHMAIDAGMNAVPDLAIQGYQSLFGRRHGVDWGQVALSGVTGAVGGLAGAGAGRAALGPMAKIFGDKTFGGRLVADRMAGLVGGGANALGAYATQGALTGDWHFDPRMITAGMLPGAMHGAGHGPGPGMREHPKGLGGSDFDGAGTHPGRILQSESAVRAASTTDGSPPAHVTGTDASDGARGTDGAVSRGGTDVRPAGTERAANPSAGNTRASVPEHGDSAGPVGERSGDSATTAPPNRTPPGPVARPSDPGSPPPARPVESTSTASTPGAESRAAAHSGGESRGAAYSASPVHAASTGAEARPAAHSTQAARGAERPGEPGGLDRSREPGGSSDRNSEAPLRDSRSHEPHRRPYDDEQPQQANRSDPHETGATAPRPSIEQAHARHGEQTPAGVSHHRGDTSMGDLPHRVPRDEHHFSADVHVGEDGHAIIGGHRYTPEEYGRLLRNAGWDGKSPIRLIGCDAATNGFAARLATHLGTDVLAPTKSAWTDTHGRLYTSTPEIGPDGNRRPRIPPDGEWETHHPDGTKTKAGDDGFAPGTPETDKHGPHADDAVERHKPDKEPERIDPADRRLLEPRTEQNIDGRPVIVDENGVPHRIDGERDSAASETARNFLNDELRRSGELYDEKTKTGSRIFFQDDRKPIVPKAYIGNTEAITGTTADLVKVTWQDGRVVTVESIDATTTSRAEVDAQSAANTLANKLPGGSKHQCHVAIFVAPTEAWARAVAAATAGNSAIRVIHVDSGFDSAASS